MQCVLPHPILHLMLISSTHDRFTNIVLLSRFFLGQTKDAKPLWHHYPSEDWLHGQYAVVQRPRTATVDDASLSPSMFEAIANALREYHSVLLQREPDADVQAVMRSLRTKVHWLCSVAQKLQGGKGPAGVTEGQGVRHSARRLLTAFQTSVHLRDRQRDFGRVLRLSVQAAWPGLFDDELLKEAVVSPSFIQRSQLIVDIALVPLSGRANVHRNRVVSRIAGQAKEVVLVRFGLFPSKILLLFFLTSSALSVFQTRVCVCVCVYGVCVCVRAQMCAGRCCILQVLYARLHTQVPDGFVRFMWSDGTDLGGYQLQMNRHIEIKKSQLVRAFELATLLGKDAVYLAHDRAVMQREQHFLAMGLDVDDAHEALPEVVWPAEEGAAPARLSIGQRRDMYSELTSLMHQHIAPPVALGLGHTDLSSKAAALMYILALESETPQQLRGLCHSIRAFCTDMGTEMGVPSFRGAPEALLPPRHPFAPSSASPFQVDAATDVHDDNDGNLLPLAVPIPGLCHIVHNLSADVDREMPGFTAFFSQLKNTGSVLCRDQSRKRLWHTCVEPLAAAPEHMFSRQVPSIYYEKRWGYVVLYIQKALPLLKVLRRCWNKHEYVHGGQAHSDGPAFDMDQFSATLASGFVLCLRRDGAASAWSVGGHHGMGRELCMSRPSVPGPHRVSAPLCSQVRCRRAVQQGVLYARLSCS